MTRESCPEEGPLHVFTQSVSCIVPVSVAAAAAAVNPSLPSVILLKDSIHLQKSLNSSSTREDERLNIHPRSLSACCNHNDDDECGQQRDAIDARMMSSSSPVSSTMLREPNNNNTNNNNGSSRGLIKANSFSFRRRYFFKSDDAPTTTPPPTLPVEDYRQSSFIRPQTETRTSLSLRSFRSSLDTRRGAGGGGGFLDKNSNHSYPTSPTTSTATTSTFRTSSSASSTPPVSPHRTFRNSVPKTTGGITGQRGTWSAMGPTRMAGVQQLSTSWEFIR